MLTEILTGRTRQITYAVWKIAAVIAGTIQVGFLTDPTPDPSWVSIMVACVLYVGGAIGALAQDNVPPIINGNVPAGYIRTDSGLVRKTNA